MTTVDKRKTETGSGSRVKKLVVTRTREGKHNEEPRTILGSRAWVWMVIQFAKTRTLEKRPF